jgi:antitoxin YefM
MVSFMQTLPATDIRKNFSSAIDIAVREKPVAFKRNRDSLMLLSNAQVLGLLKECSFKPVYISEGDGTITATLDGFDLVINAADQEQAITKLAEELIEYAIEYYDQFQLYFSSNNRKQHFPYILRVLLAEDLEEVKELIHA